MHFITTLGTQNCFTDIVRGSEGLTIRSIRTDRQVALRSVEYCSRMVYCISLGTKKTAFQIVAGRRFNDPFDPYGSLSGLTLRRVLFTDGILHFIRDT